jgi:hypothetical protein
MNKTKLKKLQQLFQGKPDEVPKGWYTVRQLVKLTGKGRATVSGMLLKHTDGKSGEVKVKNFNIRQKTSTRSTPHYFFKL